MNDSDQEGDRPTLTCPECGEIMRLVGIERDRQNTNMHILTFECRQEHIAVTTLPH